LTEAEAIEIPLLLVLVVIGIPKKWGTWVGEEKMFCIIANIWMEN
jgi:hypothetical protein